MNGWFENLKYDIPASIVVFFVAVPLCLGIALASGAPLFAGIISGIVGGIVVGIASGSALGVSGPAAGLSAVVLSSLALFNNSWETFLLAGLIAGILQMIAGFLGGGVVAYYFPSSVIKGMLVGIGIIIILKQIPYALGFDSTQSEMIVEGIDELFSPVTQMINNAHFAPALVAFISIFLLIAWENYLAPRFKICKLIQGPIVVVFLGILITWCSQLGILPLTFMPNELVKIPVCDSITEFCHQFYFPDFSQIFNLDIYKTAIIIALIASIETLLCVEATDKMDPLKRITPADRELKAQGLGNIVSALLGGLPITQVIVRSSANITFGAKTKLSAILHGALILLCVLLLPSMLNRIPLATLAAILLIVGYKLAKPAQFFQMYRLGKEQFIPFLATILGIIFEDLLIGIGIGMVIAIFVILRHNYKNSHEILHYKTDEKQRIYLTLAEEVSFLNKGSIVREFRNIPKNSDVIIDFSRTKIIDHDVVEAIDDFMSLASNKNIRIECIGRK